MKRRRKEWSHKKEKEKIILGSILVGTGTLFNLFFTAALHRTLSGQMKTFAMVPVWECLAGLFHGAEAGDAVFIL